MTALSNSTAMVVFGQSGLAIRIHNGPLSVKPFIDIRIHPNVRVPNFTLTCRPPVLYDFGTNMSTKAKDSLQKIRFFKSGHSMTSALTR